MVAQASSSSSIEWMPRNCPLHNCCGLLELVQCEPFHEPAGFADTVWWLYIAWGTMWQPHGYKDNLFEMETTQCFIACLVWGYWVLPIETISPRVSLLVVLLHFLGHHFFIENPARSVLLLHPWLRWAIRAIQKSGGKVSLLSLGPLILKDQMLIGSTRIF